ncbi:hypothetical protein [Mycobacterium sp.]|uniref:hypothetical protein n=1 Tax=Mycobacterium sp. TaxID=1785 RepID=UPI003D10CB7A
MLSSASNALMAFVLAQLSSAEQFGIVGLLIAIVSGCIGFNRGALGTPLLLTGNLKDAQAAAEPRYALAWALYNGGLGGVLLLAIGTAFHHPLIGLAFAIGLPAVLAQDVLRLNAIGRGRPDLAVVADAVWTAVMLGMFVANLCHVRESAQFSIYLWGLSAFASAALLALRLRVSPRRSGLLDWWRTQWAARVRYGSVYSVGQIGYVFITLAAVITAGNAAAAGIRGALTVFGPIATLLSAMPMVFIPHAARTGNSLSEQWRLLRKTSSATSVLTLVAAAGLVVLPTRVGAAMLGASWQETVSVLPYIGATWAAMCWMTGVFTFFQSQAASMTVFELTALLIGVQVATSFVAGLVFGSAVAITFWLALCTCVIASAGVLWVLRSIQAMAEPASSSKKTV